MSDGNDGPGGGAPGPEKAQRSEPPKVDFPPVANGVDYLLSVTEHLTSADPPAPRHLKYAVLHLQAAVEVLLKARLQEEHWSLVFADLDHKDTTRTAFDSADFKSCTTDTALARLKRIAGLEIADKPARALKNLSRSRNALQHYGLTLSAPQIEANAAEVLAFLLEFLNDELLPSLDGGTGETVLVGAVTGDDFLVLGGPPGRDPIEAALEVVRQRLGTVTSYVTARNNQIRGQLHEHRGETVECPYCGQFAIVAGKNPPTCRFCYGYWPDGFHLLDDYVSAYDARNASHVYTCPQCGQDDATLTHIPVAADPARPVALCFLCGASLDTPTPCETCHCLYEADDDTDLGMCPDCLQFHLDRF
ncbi:hypothetical protein ACIP93_33860 [Streptomyces sp. NPDC088745]|uniref:hypothetical protein n=1 Tax=Streptomyces sp. NPDC088745 TaxID=3365884 RepID=UPI003830A705